MKDSGKKVLLLVAGALIASQSLAQDDQIAPTAYAEREISEIVVFGNREADRAFANPGVEGAWREQLLEQIARVRLEEANEWRAALTYPLSDAPRIVLGFDPQFDLERRQDLDLLSAPGDTIKTATLIRAGFKWPSWK